MSELIRARPESQNAPKNIITKECVESGDEDNDEEEHYKGVVSEEDALKEDKGEEVFKSTWVHRKVSQSKLKSKVTNDPLARNPITPELNSQVECWE